VKFIARSSLECGFKCSLGPTYDRVLFQVTGSWFEYASRLSRWIAATVERCCVSKASTIHVSVRTSPSVDQREYIQSRDVFAFDCSSRDRKWKTSRNVKTN